MKSYKYTESFEKMNSCNTIKKQCKFLGQKRANKKDLYSNDNNEYNNKNNETKLPISDYKARILEMISTNKIVVISGNTGCGKSTQIPKYIYQENNNNKILITQPRRIAAISIAKRIAAELNETVGNKIGYHVKFNKKLFW